MSKGKKRPWARGILAFVGLVLMAAGGLLLYGQFAHPEKTEEIVYGAKTVVEDRVSKTKEKVTGEYPTIYLDGRGGMYELDTAYNKQFVNLEAYEQIDGLQPIWAAHNGLGGSMIIPWEEGQKLNVKGSGMDGVWVVVDSKDVDKFGPANQALGLQGEVGLQTCHWGIPTVRFVGIVPEDVYENDWPPEPQSNDKQEEGDVVELIVED